MAGLVSRLIDRWSVESAAGATVVPAPTHSGVAPIEHCAGRTRVDVRGVVRSVVVRPVDDVTALEAELDDGTGSLTLVWLGRRSIVGIESGRSLTVTGRIGRRGAERVMYNPAYTLGSAGGDA